jgi:hypothetical protein
MAIGERIDEEIRQEITENRKPDKLAKQMIIGIDYENNFFGKERDVITSNDPLPKGKVTVAFEYTQEDKTWGGGGTGRLYINDKETGETKFEHVVPVRYSATESFDIGMDLGSPVSTQYSAPFAFTGTIDRVKINVSPKGTAAADVAEKAEKAARDIAFEIQ